MANVFLCVAAARPRNPKTLKICADSEPLYMIAAERNLLFRRDSFRDEAFQRLAAHIRAREDEEIASGAAPGRVAGPGVAAAKTQVFAGPSLTQRLQMTQRPY